MRDWRRERFDWMHAILAAPELGATAKLAAASLATRYADAESGQAWPTMGELAEAVGRSERMTQYAVRDLEAAGWLVVERSAGRGRRATFHLSFPADAQAPKRCNVVRLSEARAPRKRCNGPSGKGAMGCTAYKSPTNNPRMRAGATAPKASQPRADRARAMPCAVVTDPARIAAWRAWLAGHGVTLDELGPGIVKPDRSAYRLPFERPPEKHRPQDVRQVWAFLDAFAPGWGRRAVA